MSKIRLYGDTSGFVELAAPDVADDGVLVLPTAAQGILSASGGIGSNVVSVARTTAFTTTSTSMTDWTDVDLSITPTSATSKVLVMLVCPTTANSATDINRMEIVRGATPLFGAASLRTPSTAETGSMSIVFLDSPNTTDPTTYKARVSVVSGTGTFTRGTITAIEVAA
jgi:hypothetical protein